MNKTGIRRRLRAWDRYIARYARPDRGGFIAVAEPLAPIRLTHRLMSMPYTAADTIVARRFRRT